jgi:hypothetical protein
MLFDIIIHSSGDNHIDVYLSLEEEVFASMGKIILIFFPIVDKKSLLFPLRFNFMIGEISLIDSPEYFLSSIIDDL